MKIVRLIATAVACLLCITAVNAREPAGDWLGTLTTPAGQLRLVIHITKQANDAYAGALDSLDQGAPGLALSDVSVTDDSLSFKLPAVQGGYAGRWDQASESWDGIWSQGPAKLPLKFKRGLPPAAPVIAGLDGDWDGTLDVNGAKLRLAVHIRTAEATGTTASIDSIDQNATGIAVSSIRRTGDQVELELKPMGVRFEGVLSADGQRIAGTWHQGPAALPLTIARRASGAAQAKLNRPQTPVGPFPYSSEDVAYPNSAASTPVRLAGTLTLPAGKGPFPAVVLIAGSGPNARDENILGHKIFAVLADHLTRNGVAVLRYDKRGVGQSTGDHAKATTRDFASDAEASVNYLRTRREIDPGRIGLIGHSEGGLIAPIVAASDRGVGFIVLMAGPGETGAKILEQQGHLISKASGMSDEAVAQGDALRLSVINILQDEKDPGVATAKAAKLLSDYGKAQGLPETVMAAQLQLFTSDWIRLFLSYDPVTTLREVRCPVLAIAGSKDLQVPPRENLAAIRAALSANPDATVTELPGLNHLFQPAVTGSPFEYGSIEVTLAPEALEVITHWVRQHTDRPQKIHAK